MSLELNLNTKRITEAEGAYIAFNAFVCGDVTLGRDASVWYGAVVRGDDAEITIGDRSNIQDNCVVHIDRFHPVTVGNDVSIGHGAVIHGCTIGDGTLVGMGATILNDAVIGKNCIIGAGALVPGGTVIPDGSMAFGNPARVRRPLTEKEIEGNYFNAEVYVEMAKEHFAGE